MPRFPIGVLILIVSSVLIYFGLAHRVLDRLRISDKTALAVIGAMIVGSFINIPIPGAVPTSINVGGGLIPLGLCIYLLVKAGTSREWVRALVASVITGGALYYVFSIATRGAIEGSLGFLNSVYIYPLIAGIIAYIAGRSRRAAFVAATLGVLSLDIINYFYLRTTGTPGRVFIGGAGAFDSIVLAGIVAVLLAELIGETRERLQGGPASEGRPKKLLKSLQNAEYANALGVKPEETGSDQKDDKKGDQHE
ncbi:hypothetical protein Tfer_0616 [Thermincola ferriacetica]|uniref:DUF1614 domain-containing protein n=1 Tax=Thermincola ferriacetica TaxID=281456 RepID=A0A0L6W772_9FIRM|nr:DUF1614 domain-containing protein [Thermincola ferriacetica]KNZ70934.1 hypothetical protein Tfer_0616 [Thermincola ferriacetica]